MYLRWLLFVVLALLAKAIVWLIAPLLALYSVLAGRPILPGRLALAHTGDDDLDGGQHLLGWPKASGIGLVLQRARWLWRNPAWGFTAHVLGFPADGVAFRVVRQYGHFDVGDALRHVVMTLPNGSWRFEYRRDIPLTKARYLKLWLGWCSQPKVGQHSIELEFNPFRRAIPASQPTN